MVTRSGIAQNVDINIMEDGENPVYKMINFFKFILTWMFYFLAFAIIYFYFILPLIAMIVQKIEGY